MRDNAYTGRRTPEGEEIMSPANKLDQMMNYFDSVRKGTAYLSRHDFRKARGTKREFVEAKMKEFAAEHGLKTEPTSGGVIWKFEKL